MGMECVTPRRGAPHERNPGRFAKKESEKPLSPEQSGGVPGYPGKRLSPRGTLPQKKASGSAQAEHVDGSVQERFLEKIKGGSALRSRKSTKHDAGVKVLDREEWILRNPAIPCAIRCRSRFSGSLAPGNPPPEGVLALLARVRGSHARRHRPASSGPPPRRGCRSPAEPDGVSRPAASLVLRLHDTCLTIIIMTGSLTIRLDDKQRRDLHRIASALGLSDSEFVRGLIERGVAAESAGERLRHLAGALGAAASGRKAVAGGDAWSKSLRARNWRN